jgi:hypothetical protein
MNCSVRFSWHALSIVRRFQHALQRVVVAADACRRRHLPWQHCLRGTTAWQCRLAGRAQMLEMVESIWCAGVVPTIDRATSAWRSSRRVRQHSLRCITAHRCCLAGRAQLSHNVDSFWRACTVDHRCRRPCTVAPPSCAPRLPTMYQYSLSSCGGRAQMSDNVDSSRRAVQCRPSMSPPVHGGAAVVCAKVAYDVPVLAVVVGGTSADVGQCRLVEARVQCRPSTSPPVHGGTAVVCAKVAYDVPVLAVVVGGTSADVGQCRLVEARGAVSTIDLAARARWRRRRVRQGCLRCTSTRCCRLAGRAQMSDNVDSSRRAQCSVDHRPRRPCTVAPPSCAPRLPTMYQYSLLLFGGTRADVGQCRLVEARDAVSTSDLAASVRRFRGTIEMHDCTYGCIK